MHSWGCYSIAEANRYLRIPWSHKSENKHNCIQQMTFTTSKFLTRGGCWICYDDHVDRLFVIIHFSELTLQSKPVFRSYAPSPSCILLFNVCVQQLFQVFKFRKTRSKIFEKLLPVIFQTSKHSVKFSFLFSCSEHFMNPVFSFFFLFSSSARR